MMEALNHIETGKTWNKGKLTGQKPPLKLKEIWAIRIRLQIARRHRDLALFNLAIHSKLRRCDLVKIRVKDVTHGATVARRAIVVQQKTGKSVQFEITAQTRESILDWINRAELMTDDYLLKSRNRDSTHLSTRQYARLVDNWVRDIGFDPGEYGTHSLRRTKASLIYRRTKNLRADSCYWAIQKWKAQLDTWGSRSRMLWRWRDRLKYSLQGRVWPGRRFYGVFRASFIADAQKLAYGGDTRPAAVTQILLVNFCCRHIGLIHLIIGASAYGHFLPSERLSISEFTLSISKSTLM